MAALLGEITVNVHVPLVLLRPSRPLSQKAIENIRETWGRCTKGTHAEGTACVLLDPLIEAIVPTGEVDPLEYAERAGAKGLDEIERIVNEQCGEREDSCRKNHGRNN